jgi:DNA repair protein RecO (recombination protein O)
MKPIRTKAVVLRRTNYGEADRILQLLTPDNGKIAVMAKGVRREKSKLAGAVELFAISDLTVVPGKGDIWTLTGAKMDTFFAHIMADYERMQFAYEVIKQVSKATEQVSDPSYYTLLTTALASLDDPTISLGITSSWFWLQLAILEGQGLNLSTDVNGMKLVEDQNYTFDVESMAFAFHENGEFTTEHIKLLRLLSAQSPVVVSKVKGITPLLAQIRWLAERTLAH